MGFEVIYKIFFYFKKENNSQLDRDNQNHQASSVGQQQVYQDHQAMASSASEPYILIQANKSSRITKWRPPPKPLYKRQAMEASTSLAVPLVPSQHPINSYQLASGVGRTTTTTTTATQSRACTIRTVKVK
jgi:hypothetical protein